MGSAGLDHSGAGLEYSGAGLEHSAPKMAWDALDSSTVGAVPEHSAPTDI